MSAEEPKEPKVTQPTYEEQVALLDEIAKRNAQKLQDLGTAERVKDSITRYLAGRPRRDKPMLGYVAPEAVEETITKEAEKGTAALQEMLRPQEFRVQYQLHPDRELFGVGDERYSANVGWRDLEEGSELTPNEDDGFTIEDVQAVAEMVEELERLRAEDQLPDLAPDARYILHR